MLWSHGLYFFNTPRAPPNTKKAPVVTCSKNAPFVNFSELLVLPPNDKLCGTIVLRQTKHGAETVETEVRASLWNQPRLGLEHFWTFENSVSCDENVLRLSLCLVRVLNFFYSVLYSPLFHEIMFYKVHMSKLRVPCVCLEHGGTRTNRRNILEGKFFFLMWFHTQ